MSEEGKVDSVQPDQSVSDHDREEGQSVGDTKDSVKYDTYKRTLSEAKKYKTEFQQAQERLQALEQEKLQAEGKTQELLEKIKRERDELKLKLHEAHGAFASGRAMDVIIDEANKMGVASTGLLRKAIGDKIKELEFDDEYRPNPEQVKMLLDEVRREEPLLFSKAAPRVASHNLPPQTGSGQMKPLKDMSHEELLSAFERSYRR